MLIENFNQLFLDKTLSLQLKIDSEDSVSGSRTGGYPPICFTESLMSRYNLSNYIYYFTLGNDIIDIIDGKEISIFIPSEFRVYNQNNRYPNFPLICIFHESCERGENENLCNKQILQKKIIPSDFINDMEKIEDVDSLGEYMLSPVLGTKIGGSPSLLQLEDDFYLNLEKNNYQFIMQFDESSYLKNQIIGNSPFNHGIVYFYGKFSNKVLVEFISGFWQN
jgi:hypothetical protein